MTADPRAVFRRALADLHDSGHRTPCAGRLAQFYDPAAEADCVALCARCPLVEACAASAAVEEAREHPAGIAGVRGAQTPSQRRRARDRARAAARAPIASWTPPGQPGGPSAVHPTPITGGDRVTAVSFTQP